MNLIEKSFRKFSLRFKFAFFAIAYPAIALLIVEASNSMAIFGNSENMLLISHFVFLAPLALFAVHFMTTHFSKPIESITRATKEVASGEFKTVVLKQRNDEFGELIDSMNSMIQDLQKYQSQQLDTRRKIKELANIPKENPNPVVRLNHERKVIFINKAARPIIEFFGIDIGHAIPEKAYNDLLTDLDESGRKEFVKEIDEIHYRVFVVNNEKMDTINVYGWDISEQVKAEENLIAARDKALELSQVKSKFLATMSHEIRTPMNGIIGLSSILMDMNLTKEQEELTRSVITSANSLLTIINDILDFSKIEAGKMTIEYTPMNLEDCLKDSVDLFKVTSKDKGIDIEYILDENAPKVIESDPSRLRQIIINLVGNAIKFTDEGKVSLILKSEKIKNSDDHRLWFEIRDTGIGIPYDLQHKLFQDFSQVDGSITRKFGGTGLGLAICRKLAELLGGSIWAESKPGEGSSFFFSIKAKEAVDVDSAVSEDGSVDELDASFAEHYPLSIAIAEDNKVNQMVIKKFLKKIGYTEFTIYENGFEMAEGAKDEPYDVILMDMQMPVMSGIEASNEIMEADEIAVKPFIIAMTANAMEEDKKACYDAGMKDFVSKPIHLDALALSLKKAYSEKLENEKAA